MNIWKRYSMRVSKNWVKFNKMFTLSPWYKGDPEVTRTENGELLSSIGVPIGATVVEVKALIRMDTRK